MERRGGPVAADRNRPWCGETAGRLPRRRDAHRSPRSRRNRPRPAARGAQPRSVVAVARRAGRPDPAPPAAGANRRGGVPRRWAGRAWLRDSGGGRIAAVTTVVQGARDAWQDAMAARQRTAAKVAAGALPAPPSVSGLAARLAALDALRAEGRWTRLDSELDLVERQAAAVAKGCRDTEQQAAALLDQRGELRGWLHAYRARAAKLGGAEDADLDARYDRPRELPWTAPCDLSAAADAVTGYQQAVLALRSPGSRVAEQ